ncbi:MAG: hypothetical protein IKN87_04305 [Bacilli bacterium]|nr:hypothetical protein [Bacilli bacterium]
MKESFWGVMILLLGVVSIFLIYFFQNVTNTSEHNYELLKETTEAAMYDSLDLAAYRKNGIIKIDTERFLESFIRRFAQNASLSHTYHIDIYDVNEIPPKVSLKLRVGGSETSTTLTGEKIQYNITNQIDAILETKY